MKAILLEQPGTFRHVEVEEPAAPGPGEALVRVHRVGICGTDFSGFHGKMPLMSYPRILGHELGVEVLSTGAGVSNVRTGDRCAVEPYINCQSCFACRRDGGNCCENLKVLGVHTDGGMRSRFVLPARKLHPARSLTPDQLALVETLSIGCHAVDRGGPRAGEHLLIVGAGPIGLAVLEFARLAGARVSMTDVNAQRLEFARSKGVHHTMLVTGDGSEVKKLDDVTDGTRHAVVIDATGNAKSMSHAFNYVAHTGTLVFVGISSDAISFPHPLLHRREMTAKGSRNSLPRDFERIISLIEEGQIDTRPWITHRTGFADFIGNFPAYTKPETGVIKAIVEVE